jgi:hypothetical protein
MATADAATGSQKEKMPPVLHIPQLLLVQSWLVALVPVGLVQALLLLLLHLGR